ncbi:MAG: hypothetical protein WC284_12595 [Candidimonas sp.]
MILNEIFQKNINESRSSGGLKISDYEPFIGRDAIKLRFNVDAIEIPSSSDQMIFDAWKKDKSEDKSIEMEKIRNQEKKLLQEKLNKLIETFNTTAEALLIDFEERTIKKFKEIK